jgi:hypothetical protein
MIKEKDTAMFYGEEIDQCTPDLDDNGEAIGQLDFVDNITYEYLRELARTTGIDEDDFEWDMDIIGDVNDYVLERLSQENIKVWYPYKEL